MTIKPTTEFSHLEALDMRAGKVTSVEEAKTKKPTYRLTIDFGDEIGRKVSCGAYRNYAKEELIGKIVICVTNLGSKQMGPEKSEVLVLGVANDRGETIHLTTGANVPLGNAIF